ncbi:MAG: hypothetical protein ACOY3P_01595 [Planctomycetota bacterium]
MSNPFVADNSDSHRGLSRQVQRLKGWPVPVQSHAGAAGLGFVPPAGTHLGLFELVEEMAFPEQNPASGADVPLSLRARLVWLLGDKTYGGTAHSPDVMLYHPTVLRAADGSAVGMPPLAAGQRCYGWYNRQSGRWEAILPPQFFCRFEMTAALSMGGGAEALAFTFDADGQRIEAGPPAQTIVVYDVMQRHSKMATSEGDEGAIGIARFMPDRARWEIVSMQTPGDFWGELRQPLSTSAPSVSVRVLTEGGYPWVLGGYNPFGPNHGEEITAFNPLSDTSGTKRWHAGRVGDVCYCRWDMRRSFYWIVAITPNDANWQTLGVVTRTTLSIDFYTKQYWHRYYTRQIKLPPWVSIGPEVEH